MNIIIVANGLFPSGEWADQLIEAADRVVCCDGAIEKYMDWWHRRPRRIPQDIAVVGDFDSFDRGLLTETGRLGFRIEYVPESEQDYNDLTKAVRYAMKHVTDGEEARVDIIGATGLREDHTLGNISLLAWYMGQYPKTRFRMMSDYCVLLPVKGRGRFASRPGQEVSVISLTPEEPVRLKGLCYPLDGRKLHYWWEATLNVAEGGWFEVEGGVMIVIFDVTKSHQLAESLLDDTYTNHLDAVG